MRMLAASFPLPIAGSYTFIYYLNYVYLRLDYVWYNALEVGAEIFWSGRFWLVKFMKSMLLELKLIMFYLFGS